MKLSVERVKEQLKGCQPLLAIDDCALLHKARWTLELLQNHGPEEVRELLWSRFGQVTLCYTDNVVPERFPLVLFVPDVRPLEEGHDEALRLGEHRLRCADLGFHAGSSYLRDREPDEDERTNSIVALFRSSLLVSYPASSHARACWCVPTRSFAHQAGCRRAEAGKGAPRMRSMSANDSLS
jgi:hypothetical protein